MHSGLVAPEGESDEGPEISEKGQCWTTATTTYGGQCQPLAQHVGQEAYGDAGVT